MSKRLKQTFLVFQNDDLEAIYEVAVRLIDDKYVTTLTEDILYDGLPTSSNVSVPPYSWRKEDTLEKATIFYKAYISDLQQSRYKNGWDLTNLVEKIG